MSLETGIVRTATVLGDGKTEVKQYCYGCNRLRGRAVVTDRAKAESYLDEVAEGLCPCERQAPTPVFSARHSMGAGPS